MNVLMVNDFSDEVGGAESYLDMISSELIDKHGVDVIGFSGRANESKLRIWNPLSKLRLKKHLKKIKPDIIHYHNVYGSLSPSVITTDYPTVMTVHDYRFNCPVARLDWTGRVCSHPFDGNCHRCSKFRFLVHLIRNRICESKFKTIGTVITPSNFMKTMWDMVIPNKSIVLHNAVDMHQFPLSSEDNNYILYVGRLAPEKGVQTLIDAVIGTGMHLVIAGGGPFKDELMARAKGHDTITFLGKVPHGAIDKLYESSSIVCIPSLWPDNSPMVTYEAMSTGKPVVASNVGGLPDLVTIKTGRLVPPNDVGELRDALKYFMDNLELRKETGLEAHKWVDANFTIQEHAKKLKEIYNETISNHSSKE